MISMATSSRMLTLLSLLQSRRDWPGQALADRLEISERTVRRDVDRLRELGYRIRAIKGPDGGYRLDAGSELPPLLFDDDQAVVLAIALQSAAVVGTGFEDAAMRALATVRQVMPSRLRNRIDSLEITAMSAAVEAEAEQVDSKTLVDLAAAIRAGEVVRFDYGERQDSHEGDPRRVEPMHLVTRAARWYLVAWDLDRADWRTFRVDRIALRSHTGPRFIARQLPAASVAEFVSGRFKGSESTNEWPCQGEVILAVTARDVAPYVGDGVVEDLGPDRCRLTLGSWSWAGLAASLGRFDADIEVVGPPELKRAFADLGERYARAAQ